MSLRFAKFGLPPLGCPNWNDYCVDGYNPHIPEPPNQTIGGNAGGGNQNNNVGNTYNPNVVTVSNSPNNNIEPQAISIPTQTRGLIDQVLFFAKDNPTGTFIFFGVLGYLIFKK